jgi:predicted glycosyltransferase/nucleoside-diphosphate-sugar epimerase
MCLTTSLTVSIAYMTSGKDSMSKDDLSSGSPAGCSTLVTGCAGFLGSHLCEALLARGHRVTGVDCFSDYYPRALKEANLAALSNAPHFRLVEADLAVAPLEALMDGVDVVYHLAGQPGVRPSFGEGFHGYLHHNVRATQRLLEIAAQREVQGFVYASSSSVYGDQDVYPAREDAPVRPVSPYGATKVITEQLANAFWRSHGVPVVGLRYFTVYGPRQRPDMAFSRFLERALAGQPLTVLGDGRQVREFTYVGDVVRTTIAAAELGERGSVYNVGGGEPVALLDVIAMLERLLGGRLALEHLEAGRGDPRRTEADVTRAARDLGYRPSTTLEEGLTAQIASLRDRPASQSEGSLDVRRADRGDRPKRAARVPSASPETVGGGARVLAYSHDGYGLGHLRRNLRIVSGLRRQRPDLEAVLVTGAKSAERLVAPFGMACVPLPSVVKVANGRYVAEDQASSLEEVMRTRSDLLADTVSSFRPDLLLVDRYPRGMNDELARALEVYADERPGAPAVLGMRDILDSPEVIRSEWEAQGHNQAIREIYRMVLCYGDPSVYDPIREYGLPSDVAERVRFTGYLADELFAGDAPEVRRRHEAEGRLAVCTLGGGKDAASIAHTFLSAIDHLRVDGWTGVLITGPYMDTDDVERLRQAANGVPVIRMVDDVPSYLAAADAVVCMGGYNTTCEVLALAVPAVIVPRIQPRQEQHMRAERLSARGLVRWMHPSSLSPRDLAENMQVVAAQPRVDLAARIGAIAHRGVQTSAQHLAALLPAATHAELPGRRPTGGRDSARVADASR